MLGGYTPGTAPPAGIALHDVYTSTVVDDATAVRLYVNGVDWTARVIDWPSATKEDILNDVPDTFTFQCLTAPARGSRISLWRDATLEFAGYIVRTRQRYDGIRHNISYEAICQDLSWAFNRRRITKRWTATSGTTIAQQIVAYATGFTTSHIEAGLPTLDEFQVVLRSPMQALQDLCAALGNANFRIDYTGDVHLFTTPETDDAPETVSNAALSGDRLVYTRDDSQRRTRVLGRGAGSTATAEEVTVSASSTTLPVRDTAVFDPDGGEAIAGANIFTYGGVADDVAGSTVTGPLGSPSGVTPTVSTTESGGANGSYKYWKTDVDANGEESEVSSASSTASPGTVSTPSAPSNGADQHDVGSYDSTQKDWSTNTVGLTRSGSAFTFTLPISNISPGAYIRLFGGSTGGFDGIWQITSIASTTATVQGISTSAPSSDTCHISFITDGPFNGTYDYGVSFVSALGETAISSALQVTVSQHAGAYFSSGSSLSETTGGSLSVSSTYKYWSSIATMNGETVIIFNDTASTNGSQNAVQITLSGSVLKDAFADLRAMALKIYRSRAGGSTPFLVRTITREELSQAGALASSGAVDFVFTDITADSGLGALPGNNIAGAAIGFTIPTTSDARCTGRRIWRKKGGTWYPLALISDRDTTVLYFDTLPDDQLGVGFEGADPRPFGGAAVTLAFSAVAAGTTSNLYRSKAGDTTKGFLCGSVKEGATSFVDKKADEDLGREMPTSSRRRIPVGATTIQTNTSDFPAQGWVRVGSQVIQYLGKPLTYILGSIPASGPGSIQAPIPAGSEIELEPHLTGIPVAPDDGRLLYPVLRGEAVRLYHEADDAAAQSNLANADLVGDGVLESPIDDTSLQSAAALAEACEAELAFFGYGQDSITRISRDPKYLSGKALVINLGSPTSISGTFLIQRVVTREYNKARHLLPLREATAGPMLLNVRTMALRRRADGG